MPPRADRPESGGAGSFFEGLRHDLRHLSRSLRRTPGFAIVAVFTLAIGIGVTTAVVSIVDHVIVQSLPFRDAGRLMMMVERGERGGFRIPSAPTANDWANDPGVRQAFDGLTFIRGDGVTIRHGEAEEHLAAAYVAPDFFNVLGARAAVGRFIAPDEFRADAPAVAVISYSFWRNSLGGDPAAIGKTINIDSIPTTVAGVMPVGATFPDFASVWQPISHYRHPEILARRSVHADSRTLARLKPGVDSARAIAMMREAGTRLALTYPDEQAHWSPAMRSLRESILGGIGPTLYTLAGAAIAVLLLACANVANLLLVRIASRGRELAVRGALGASRSRIVRQLLTESFALAIAGGLLGSVIAVVTVSLARKLPSNQLPRVEELSVDHRVLLVALAASTLTALVCGLWPALRASRPSNAEMLRTGGTGSAGVRSEARMRRLLVTAQFALALMLLVGAGLLIQSFRRAMAVDVGFDPHGLIAIRLNPSTKVYATATDDAALYQRLMQSLRATPGVTDVAFIQHAPFGSASILTPIEIDGQPASDTASRQVFYRTVSETYLRTMKMRVAAGRWFDESDMRSPGGAFIVNQTLAKMYWADQNPIGKRVTVHRSSQGRPDVGQPLPGVVVGVVSDVHQVGQDVPPDPEIFVPYTLETWPWGNLVVRARDASHIVPALRTAITAIDPTLIERGSAGDARFSIIENSVVRALEPRKLSMSLIGSFAVCALVLAATGMYGVIAYGVAQRTREIGVRKALGATEQMIARLVLRESLVLASLGVVIGCVGAWMATRLIQQQLFDTPPLDPLPYIATIVSLVAIAMLSSWIPARRATRLDPTVALRGD